MNKIIFDQYLHEEQVDLVQLEPVPPKEVKEYGMMPVCTEKQMEMFNYKEISYIDPKSFRETFKDFCFSTLFIR